MHSLPPILQLAKDACYGQSDSKTDQCKQLFLLNNGDKKPIQMRRREVFYKVKL